MARILLVLTASTDQPDRAATGVRTALAAQRAGHEVVLWLSGEGVRMGIVGVAETLREPGPETVAEMVVALAEGGARLLMERPSFENRDFAADAIRPGAEVAESAGLAALLADGFLAAAL